MVFPAPLSTEPLAEPPDPHGDHHQAADGEGDDPDDEHGDRPQNCGDRPDLELPWKAAVTSMATVTPIVRNAANRAKSHRLRGRLSCPSGMGAFECFMAGYLPIMVEVNFLCQAMSQSHRTDKPRMS